MFQNPNNASILGQNIANLCMTAVEGCSLSIELFLHRHFGARYVGFQAAVGAMVMGLYIAFCAEHGWDARPVIYFLMAYLALAVVARVDALRRAMRGDSTHSRYNGTPWLIKPGRVSEIKIKFAIEPMIAAAIAFIVGDYNQPLAIYLGFATLCLVTCNLRYLSWMRNRLFDMNDAVSDQQQVAGQFRDLRGDNF